ERASIARNRSRLFVGSPQTVMEKITPLIETCKADEVMVITATYDHDARKRSYSLLADAFGIGKQAVA
nr:LLM class flavin-dependent oxidoreductase [Afipia sp.]